MTALAAVAVLAVLVLAGLLLVAQQRRVLTEALDESLEERADDLVALGDDVPATISGLGEDDTRAQVVIDGVVVAASRNVSGDEPMVEVPTRAQTVTVGGLAGEPDRFRVVSRLGEDPARAVLVAGTLDDIDESVAALTRSLVLAVPLVVVVVALLVWWLVGRTLRPVEAIRAEVAAIGGAQRSRRVPVPPGDDEVARLARTMNDMLGRLDDAAWRQQRFLADASHELRSPLARMRTELEVDLAHPGTADVVATHRSVLEEVVHLQRLAEDLLLLARSDAGSAAPVGDGTVDLADVVRRVAQQLPARPDVHVGAERLAPVQVRGDAGQLARAVGNLADNGLRHARSLLELRLEVQDGTAVLTVEDDGPGVPPGDQERVFERFARVEGARTAGGGVGLGLAIARDIVERHGGTLVLDADGPGSGARFRLTLPLRR
ncbi:MAG: sensor histidine kinase [Acidimicrobiia bacterium]